MTKFYIMFNRQTTRNMVTTSTFSATVRTDARKQNAVRTVIRTSFDKHVTLKDSDCSAIYGCHSHALKPCEVDKRIGENTTKIWNMLLLFCN